MKQIAQTYVDRQTYTYITEALNALERPGMIRSMKELSDGSIRIEYLDSDNDRIYQLIEEAGAE